MPTIYRYKIKTGKGYDVWATKNRPSKLQKKPQKTGPLGNAIINVASRAIVKAASSGLKARRSGIRPYKDPAELAHERRVADATLERDLGLPQNNQFGGSKMDSLDQKIVDLFPGKIVRKDLTALMKRGANVPTFVLEYLLGMYCSTDDEDAIASGLEKIRKILSENYVRPDESEKIKSKIRENGEYTVIDKVSARLDEYKDIYVARFTNLEIEPFILPAEYASEYTKILTGGIWCITRIAYQYENEDYEYVYSGSRGFRSAELARSRQGAKEEALTALKYCSSDSVMNLMKVLAASIRASSPLLNTPKPQMPPCREGVESEGKAMGRTSKPRASLLFTS